MNVKKDMLVIRFKFIFNHAEHFFLICTCFFKIIQFTGSRCDVCADNYFGSPDQPGGVCTPCNCNNNVDVARPGNCDHKTGQCLDCLFHTEGFHCELCKAGYYGDAVHQTCIGKSVWQVYESS